MSVPVASITRTTSTSSERKTQNVEGTLERVRALKRRAVEKLTELYREIVEENAIIVETPKDKRRCLDTSDLDSYKSRISTYSTTRWANMPGELPARFAAEHGWICLDNSLLSCATCKKIISTSLPKITTVNPLVYKKCVRHIREQMENAHELTCPNRAPNINFFINLSTITDIEQRYMDMFHSYDSVDLSNINLSDTDVSMEELSSVFSVPLSNVHSLTASQLTVTMWEARDSEYGNGKCVHCALCSRSLSLSSFPSPCNPLSQHFKWCPIFDVHSSGSPMWKYFITRLHKKKLPVTHNVQIAKNSFCRSVPNNTDLELQNV